VGILIGVALALIAAFIVVQPLLHAASGRTIDAAVPLFSDSDDEDDPLLARRDRALAALKEIDFDRATGKLSDTDYEELKAEFSQEALEAIRAADAAAAPTVHAAGPADEAVEALIASAASPAAPAARRFCLECGSALDSAKKFCLQCGAPIGALLP
jgi:hypothetical protein